MKTFLVLFVIAASLPADAQRVKENIRQKVEIMEQSSKEVRKSGPRKASRQSKIELKAVKDDTMRQE